MADCNQLNTTGLTRSYKEIIKRPQNKALSGAWVWRSALFLWKHKTRALQTAVLMNNLLLPLDQLYQECSSHQFKPVHSIAVGDLKPFLLSFKHARLWGKEREKGCGSLQGRAGTLGRIDEGPRCYQPCLEACWIKINYPGLGINHQERTSQEQGGKNKRRREKIFEMSEGNEWVTSTRRLRVSVKGRIIKDFFCLHWKA